MLLNIIRELYNLLEKDALSLLYLGDESDQMTDKLIRINNENLKVQQQGQLGRKMAFLIAESFQNIVRHHQPVHTDGDLELPNMFMLRHKQDTITISSANRMAESKVNDLEYQLNHLNTLTQAQLRKHYLNVLPDNSRTEGGGAGLGLIEMARKTGQPFSYNFVPLNGSNQMAMFYFQLRLLLQEEGNVNEAADLKHMQQMYNIMRQNGVLLLYRSNFMQESMLPVLSMIEHNVGLYQPNRFKQKSTLYILVEMFQNIMKHAAIQDQKQDGVLVLARYNQKFVISTGNYIENEKLPKLKEHLEEINSLDEGGLQKLYKQELLKNTKHIKGGAGLGLIETARYGNPPYKYSFEPAHDNYSFFTLLIEV